MLQRIGNELTFFGFNNEGGREQNVIASRAVDGALSRIDENILLQRRNPNLFGDSRFLGKRLAYGFAFHELHALQKT